MITPKYIFKITSDEEKSHKIWEETGLLEGLDEETAKKVSTEFTKMAKYLLATQGEYMDAVEICVFAAIRKIYSQNDGPNSKYSPMAICDELNRLLKDAANIEAVENVGIDYEAVVCSAVSEFFSNKYEAK